MGRRNVAPAAIGEVSSGEDRRRRRRRRGGGWECWRGRVESDGGWGVERRYGGGRREERVEEREGEIRQMWVRKQGGRMGVEKEERGKEN
eukprot:757515-Hanusia_phi.AAC.1